MEVGTKVWLKNDDKEAQLTNLWFPGEVQSKVKLIILCNLLSLINYLQFQIISADGKSLITCSDSTGKTYQIR
jgi:hypothetical protein